MPILRLLIIAMKLKRIISSYVTTIILLFAYACGLAIATFIEKYYGTATAKTNIYHSPLFMLLQLFMVVNLIASMIRYRLFRKQKWGMATVHFSFIIILLGALVSHLFGQEGIIHIREGEVTDKIAIHTSKGTEYKTLPFHIELVKFSLSRYPGSMSPSSYESELLIHTNEHIIHRCVSMNNVLDIDGYRLFQASYDQDEHGTVLSANKDTAGRNITYTGYFLLIVGFISCFISRHSRFRLLSRKLKNLRSTALLILFAASFSLKAGNTFPLPEVLQQYNIPAEHAALFGKLPMQATNGRMVPVNTFSSEILRKLHKSSTIGNLDSDRFLISLLAMPDAWMRVPFISLSNEEIATYFNLSRKQFAYIEVFDTDGSYKLQSKLEEAYHRIPAERTRFDKELLKLDEKINILHQLFSYKLLNLFPNENDPNNKWYAPGDDLSSFQGKDSLLVSRITDWYIEEVQASLNSSDWSKPNEIINMIATYQQAKNKTLPIDPDRIQAEIKYNRLNIFNQCKKWYLLAGGVLLILSFVSLFKQRKPLKYIKLVAGAIILCIFTFHTYGMGMRWYIAGYAPWSNSYETMVYVSWATGLSGLLFARKSSMTFALATLLAGIILFVSGLNWMDPQIGTLVPVLKSPWLMFHVAVIVAAYGFFGTGFLLGITNLVLLIFMKERNRATLYNRIQELSIINEMSLLAGLALMTIGTFLGAIWANESWGRYWGWDPKETWALITIIVYAITLHIRLVKRWNNVWMFNFMSVISFASVLMTFLGVNYFLSGMHSYGQSNNMESVFTYLYIVAIAILILGIFSRLKYNNHK